MYDAYAYMPRHSLNKAGEIYLYKVEKGDTVYQIARQFNSDVEWIKALNQLNQEALIYPDQVLLIPVVYPMPRQDMMNRGYELYF